MWVGFRSLEALPHPATCKRRVQEAFGVQCNANDAVHAALTEVRACPERMAELASLTTMAWLLAPSLTLQS